MRPSLSAGRVRRTGGDGRRIPTGWSPDGDFGSGARPRRVGGSGEPHRPDRIEDVGIEGQLDPVGIRAVDLGRDQNEQSETLEIGEI